MLMRKSLPTIIFLIIMAFLALILVKGQMGLQNQLYFQYDHDDIVGGPFEASNSNSRYALTEAIVLNNSMFFTPEQAEFASPDLVYYKDNYFSIFTPGVSFFGIPFYILGNILGAPQLFTYLSTIIFAILNAYLVYKLASRLGAGKYVSYLSGFIFLFTTNAIAYALTLTQHHLSTAIILIAVLNALNERTWKNNILFGFIYGIGILIDIPNGLMLLPAVAYVAIKSLDTRNDQNRFTLSLNFKTIGLALGLMPLLVVFALYNYSLTGSYTTLGQNIGRTPYEKTLLIEDSPKIELKEKDSFDSPLEIYNIPEGFYIFFLSDERGIVFYSPVIMLGIIGLYFLSRREKVSEVMLWIMAADVLIYSMFGDQWGGWAFGPRYLIPGMALASVGVAATIEHWKKSRILNAFVLALIYYGLSVSILGAMTTNNIPPKVEAIHLQNPTPYTYELNWQFLKTGKSSSLFYDVFLKDIMSAKDYYYTYVITVAIGLTAFYLGKVTKEKSGLNSNA